MKQLSENQNHQNRLITVITGWWRRGDVTTDLNRIFILVLLSLGLGFIFNMLFVWPKQSDFRPNQPVPKAQEIGLERAHQLAQNEQVVFVDTRGSSSYADKHIAGAVSLPSAEFKTRYADFAKQVDKNHTLILYCATGCGSKDRVARELQRHSYKHLYLLAVGVEEWAAAGYPVATGQDTHHASGE